MAPRGLHAVGSRLRAALAVAALAVAALVGVTLTGVAPAAPAADHLSHGRFKDVTIYAPVGTATAVVLLLSGRDGASVRLAQLALALARHGALVAAIDGRQFEGALDADGGDCVFPDGDLENLSHFVQAYYHLPTYQPPLLLGYGSGATLAYGSLAQAPANTFAGVITVGFCPATSLRKPLCKSEALQLDRTEEGFRYLPAPRLSNPWVALQGERDSVCTPGAIRDFTAGMSGAAVVSVPGDLEAADRWMPQLLAAFDTLVHRTAPRNPPSAPVALGNLPVVEVPPRPDAAPTDILAVILSGDGGWAGLDKEVAQALAEHGIPVAGLDSLRYFWTARTPQGLAADLDSLARYYLQHFGKKRVLLIGYSQGADVLPFAVNRLAPATRARVALVVLMGMSEHAVFEFHVSNWLSDDNSGPATMPEVSRITGVPILCIYGEGDNDSLCPKLDAATVAVVKLPGGHHFNGDYARLAREILAAANR
jgi:type IV secretory pathway VirJ component